MARKCWILQIFGQPAAVFVAFGLLFGRDDSGLDREEFGLQFGHGFPLYRDEGDAVDNELFFI